MRRKLINSGRFMCRASTVARPRAVRPTILKKSSLQAKWRDQRWRRGWKRETLAPRPQVARVGSISLVAVAAARQSQIVKRRQAALAAREDVIDVKGLCGKSRGAEAVLAAPPRPFADPPPQNSRYALRRHRSSRPDPAGA